MLFALLMLPTIIEAHPLSLSDLRKPAGGGAEPSSRGTARALPTREPSLT
jgi:hypothetical protein